MKDKLSIRVSIFVGERQTKFRSWLWYENNFMSTFSADTNLWSGKQSLSNGRNKKASDEISPFIVPLQGSHYQLSDWNKCLLEKNISSAIGCILKMVNVSVASFASHGDFARLVCKALAAFVLSFLLYIFLQYMKIRPIPIQVNKNANLNA